MIDRVQVFIFLIVSCSSMLPRLAAAEETNPQHDYLSFAQGAVPVALEGDAMTLKVGMDKAMLVIDGNAQGFAVTPKPGMRAC